MIAAITLFSVLTLSILVIRVAAVALRLTGVPEGVARFQARSAFTGAGFTTAESEAMVHHPLRRRIIGLLMITGNLGLVSILTTVVVSFVNADNGTGGLLTQALWLAAVLIVLWAVALNPWADRLMCGAIGRLLARIHAFGDDPAVNLVQLPGGYSVYRLPAGDGRARQLCDLTTDGWVVLGLWRGDGGYLSLPAATEALRNGDEILAYGPDRRLDRDS